ncbi:MAG: PAS domain S-box protein, partial [Chitinophagales bacterium]
NSTAQELTGWNKEEALGKPLDFVFDLVNESTGLPEVNPVKKAMQEKQIVVMASHTILIRNDKSQRFIDDSAAPILNDYGELVGAVLIFRDVTDKVEIRRKLIESENRLRKIIENSSTVITIRDKEGRFTMVNQAFEKLTGCTEEELIGKKNIPSITPARINENNSIMKPIETDSVITTEEEWITHDGSIRHFVAVRFPIKDAAGKITGVGAVCTDITAQKQQLQSKHEMLLREQMEESESHYKELANSISEMFFSIDRNDRFLFWNHACERQTGRHEEEVLGKKIDEVFPGTEFQFLKEKFHNALRKQTAEIFNSEFQNNGRTQNFSVHVYTAAHGISVLMADVTTQRKTEQEAMKLVESLQQKNKDLRQFAYIISHNLRAPIAKIQGLADLFSSDTVTDEINTKIIDSISRELKSLDQIVNDLTDIISIREIEYKSKELVSLHEELEQSRIILSEEIEASHALITEDFSDVPSVNSIKSYLHSILINLIGNAIKFRSLERRPEISIASRQTEQFTVISVQDNGLGINMAKHGSKLFALYKRFHNHS